MWCDGWKAEYRRVRDDRSRKREAEEEKGETTGLQCRYGQRFCWTRPTGGKGESDSGKRRGFQECTLSPQSLARRWRAASDWFGPMTTGICAGVPMDTVQDV